MRVFAQRTAIAVTASLALLTSAAHAETCWSAQEARAVQIRDFHLMLMVGALQCQSSNPVTVQDYNGFVTRQGGLLDSSSHVLKAHFLRDAGPADADAAYDRYSTATANVLERKMVGDATACARIDTLARVASVANEADLMVLAQSFSTRPMDNICPVAAIAAVKPVAMELAAATPGPVPGVAAPAPPTPAPTAAPAPSRDAVAASPNADPAAMKAAIAALQSAVAALQAASPSTAPVVAPAALAQPAARAELIAVKIQEAPIVPPRD